MDGFPTHCPEWPTFPSVVQDLGSRQAALGSPSSPQTLAHHASCAVGMTALPVHNLSQEQLTCEKGQQVRASLLLCLRLSGSKLAC